MKIFKIHCDSIAAESLEEAQQWYDTHPTWRCQIDPDLAEELEGEKPYELSEDALRRMTFFDEDSGFRGPLWDYLQNLTAKGQQFPCFIGCSEC